jgi:hypothetical protein
MYYKWRLRHYPLYLQVRAYPYGICVPMQFERRPVPHHKSSNEIPSFFQEIPRNQIYQVIYSADRLYFLIPRLLRNIHLSLQKHIYSLKARFQTKSIWSCLESKSSYYSLSSCYYKIASTIISKTNNRSPS